MRHFLRKFAFYTELRYLYRVFFIYRKPTQYIYNRFVVGPSIKTKPKLKESPLDKSFSIHLLSGHQNTLMLAWALASWQEVAPKSAQVYVHEDGTFTGSDRELIKSISPQAEIVDREIISPKVMGFLDKYPALKKMRESASSYIFVLKLVDPIFVSQASYCLIIDTDVLWFSSPGDLFQNIGNLHPFMLDAGSPMEYKFSDGSELSEIARRANSGIVGYPIKDNILESLEAFCQKNGSNNPSRVIEQAAFAHVLSADPNFRYLPPDKYGLKWHEGMVVRHYTGPVREKFWFEGVKKLAKEIL